MRLTDQNMRGRTVIGADGQVIGELNTLFLDGEGRGVESYQVKLRREVAEQLGSAHGFFHAALIEVPIRLIQSVGDTIVLSVSVDELRRSLPGEEESAAAHE